MSRLSVLLFLVIILLSSPSAALADNPNPSAEYDGLSTLWVLIAILGAAVVIVVLLYNGLVGKKNRVENAFGSMDALLKKRYDLIPNLVETAKGYMEHERGTFEAITEARSKAMGAGTVGGLPGGIRGREGRLRESLLQCRSRRATRIGSRSRHCEQQRRLG